MMRRFLLFLVLFIGLTACAPRTLNNSLRGINAASQSLPLTLRNVTGEERDRAVGALTLGGTVVLSEGAYMLDSALIIESDLRLVGAGANQSFLILRDDATNDAMIRFRGERLIINGVSLIYQGARPAHVLQIENGVVSVENSRFTGGVRRDIALGQGEAGSGLVLSGSSRGMVTNSIFSGNQQHGIAIEDGAAFILRHNFATHNGINGIRSSGNSEVELTRNNVRGNGGSGINFFGFARGQAINNYSELNGIFGIRIQQNATPTLIQNVLRANDMGSIAYYDTSGGSADDNICGRNGLFAASTATPVLGERACYTVDLQPIQSITRQ